MASKQHTIPGHEHHERFGKVRASVWDSDRFRLLTPAQRLVYVTLLLYAKDGGGEVWPKQATIARVTGLQRRAVIAALQRLAELGYLEVKREVGGMRRSNHYFLMTPGPEAP